MTFNSSPFIFICPNPKLTILTCNQLYLISALLCMFYKNTASKFLNFAYHLGDFHMAVAINNILVLAWSSGQRQVMCLNFKFCLSFSSVIDFKSRISSSVCGKLSIFKLPNKILNSISKVPVKQTKHLTKLQWTLFSATKLSAFDQPVESCSQS